MGAEGTWPRRFKGQRRRTDGYRRRRRVESTLAIRLARRRPCRSRPVPRRTTMARARRPTARSRTSRQATRPAPRADGYRCPASGDPSSTRKQVREDASVRHHAFEIIGGDRHRFDHVGTEVWYVRGGLAGFERNSALVVGGVDRNGIDGAVLTDRSSATKTASMTPPSSTTGSCSASKARCPKPSCTSSGPACAAASSSNHAASNWRWRCRSVSSTTPPARSCWTPTSACSTPSPESDRERLPWSWRAWPGSGGGHRCGLGCGDVGCDIRHFVAALEHVIERKPAVGGEVGDDDEFASLIMVVSGPDHDHRMALEVGEPHFSALARGVVAAAGRACRHRRLALCRWSRPPAATPGRRWHARPRRR